MKSQNILGVDVGGVIIDGVKNDNTDTSFFGDNYLKTTAVPHAFEALKSLASPCFGNRVFIVSKCGKRIETKTRHWFDHHRFYEATGILESNLRFCRERHEKAPICRELGVTHFVDDKLEVLSYLVDIVPNLYLFRPSQKEIDRFARFLPRVTRAQSWQELLVKLPLPQS